MINSKKKAVIPIPKLRIWQYLFLFDIRYCLKISVIFSEFMK